ncbi:hypothetical protein PQX77_012668 [Marasmius sp. AFHP31]|nr:hypothetical protein PQX77_012668 [Marasmius sp. AFHP31]
MALVILLFFYLFSLSYSQSISTSSPVPPLQWLNISPSLTGTSKPPPLKDAFVSYNQNSRTVIIFGGISQSGLPTSETYLLNLDTLTWSKPAPPAGLEKSPSSRSAQQSFSGPDFASNSRSAFMLYGGTGLNQEVLTDAWEFDFQFQFWSQVGVTPGSPGSDSSIAGGIDPRTTGVQAVNNTFNVITSGTSSALWRFDVSGTLASNIPDGVLASWDSKTVSNLPTFANSASTVVGNKVVSIGGCTNPTNNSCAFIVNSEGGQAISTTIPPCASPRTGARVVPNFSTASAGFASQVFLLLGTLDSDWKDDNGLNRGEVAVLDINTGTWSRLIPSGDPSATTESKVPSPREGAAVSVLPGTGGSRLSSDIIVFGGRDASGNYMDDVWILRAYTDTITPSSPHWSGFGDGRLRSGYNADGSGVTVEYLTQCASHTVSPTTSSTTQRSPEPTATNNPGNDGGSFSNLSTFNTSISHKALSPVSVALLLLALVLYRASSSTHVLPNAERRMGLIFTSGIILIAAYALGLVGIVTSFTSISRTSTMEKRSPSSLILKTTHGQAGLALFVVIYALIPVLLLLKLRRRANSATKISASEARNTPRQSEDKSHVGSMSHTSSPPSGSPRPRTQSLTLGTMTRTSHDHDRSDDDALSMSSSGPHRTFEVMNRPKRRRPSGSVFGSTILHDRPRAAGRSLSEIDWLQRRRSLNAVGELDYAITQAIRAQELPPTPATTDALMSSTTRNNTRIPRIPSPVEILGRIILQLSLCGLCVVALIALWTRTSSKVYFGLFLAWTLSSYILFIILAWHGRPATSTLTIAILRLRGKAPLPPPPTTTPEHYISSAANTPTPLNSSLGYPFPANSPGPYTHHFPPQRSAGPDEFSYAGPRSVETDFDDDPDEDEDTRQRRIESEMERREVSIVTVPKRKLLIANPS